MHLVYPPKFYITIVSSFSWVSLSSQEKSKTMVMQNVWGVNKVHYGVGENGQYQLLIRSVLVNIRRKALGHLMKFTQGRLKYT